MITMKQHKEAQGLYEKLTNALASSQIAELLLENGVGAVYLFGSHVKGIERPESDIDIGVVLLMPAFPDEARRIYDNILEAISDAISTVSPKTVDLVILQHASLALQFEVVVDGKVLFEVSPCFSLNYTESVIKEYADFDYQRQVFNRATLEACA